MSFLDNFKMAVGLKPKTEKYIQTTANTLRKTQGDARADRYLADMKAKGNLKGSSSKKSPSRGSAAVNSSLTFADEVLKDTSRFLPPSVDTSSTKITPTEQKKFNEQFKKANTYRDSKTGQIRTGRGTPTGVTYTPTSTASTATAAQSKKDRDDFLRNFEMQSARADVDPTGQTYQMYGRSVNLEKDPTLLQQGIGGGMTGSVLNYLAGSRPLDPIVNIINGKPIYQDSQGRTYAYDNLFGMRYDTVSDQSLDVLPRDMPQSTDDDDGPSVTEMVEEKAPDDPCPEGYMYDTEKKQCVVDPFSTPFADPVMPVSTPSVVSPYTQVAPMTLGQLNPTVIASANPLAMQQANMPPQGLASLPAATNRVS